jgi:hypothetical protein
MTMDVLRTVLWLNLSEHTVRNYLIHIFDKLGIIEPRGIGSVCLKRCRGHCSSTGASTGSIGLLAVGSAKVVTDNF